MKITKEEKTLSYAKKIAKKNENKYYNKGMLKKRIKNSSLLSNIKNVEEDGLINFKSGEVCSLIEVSAIDLWLTSRQEKNNFFFNLKALYQIKDLNLKCYKLDEKINLNKNKVNLEGKIEYYSENEKKKTLLEENKKLIEYLEDNDFTVSSIYYWVITAKSAEELEKIINEVQEICSDMSPQIKLEIIQNKLLIYKFISNLYLASNSLDQLIWSDYQNCHYH